MNRIRVTGIYISSTAVILLIALLFSACSSHQKRENDKLWIVTDLGKSNAYEGNQYSDGQQGGKFDLEFIIDYFGGLPGGKEVELEVLPTDDEDLKARLSRLKVEIMSGGGPDIFLLSSDMSNPTAASNQPRLFPVPEKAVQGKYFLPLDDYIKNAKHMKWENINQAVMAVGRSEEGQMLLPMFHSINMGIAYSELDPSTLPDSWLDAVESRSSARDAYGNALWNGCFRSMVLAHYVDFQKEELLITEEELSKRIKEALALNQSPENTAESEWLFTPLVVEGLWESTLNSDYQETIFPLRNAEGTVTSCIDSFIAINRNTPYPEESFALVDMLMSEEFLTLEPFWDEERMARNSGVYLFSELPVWGGLPVYDSLMENESLMQRHQVVPKSRLSIYKEALSDLYVYLPSTIDSELEQLFLSCKQATSEDEINSLIHKSYLTMQMLLAES